MIIVFHIVALVQNALVQNAVNQSSVWLTTHNASLEFGVVHVFHSCAYGAEMQFRASQAAQVAASAARQEDHPEASAGDNMSALANSPDTDELPSRPSKLSKVSEAGSGMDLSNESSETEEFGNGALVRPKASPPPPPPAAQQGQHH